MFRDWLLVIAALSFPAFATERLTLTVHVYDFAETGSVLERATERASYIFEESGVRLEWRLHPMPPYAFGPDNPFNPERTPTDLIVRLLPKDAANRLTRGGSIAGIAYPVAPGHFRYLATLFYDRLAEAAHATRSPISVILGNLIAHELGHLLLGPGAHTRTGLMRCPWDVAEFRAAERGELLFVEPQARIIRAEAVRRMRAASSTGPLARGVLGTQ